MPTGQRKKTTTTRRTAARPPATSAGDARVLIPLPSHDAIATRAYELFLERGGDHGRDFDDWLAAERELQP
jgi:hypothetical protein